METQGTIDIKSRMKAKNETDTKSETALFVSAFFDELTRWGVHEVVISPGSRSTALAMVAYEMSVRFPERMRIYVDIDERGAAFFALGLAKASGRPVCLVCTSGTALANYYPAVMEAETSRVPIIVLSGDRPLHLQDLGAPQTVDQLKAYGSHVRAFREMPLPAADARSISFARQAAREAYLSAIGPSAVVEECGPNEVVIASRGCRYLAGPVHINFQFDEPLTPNLDAEELFSCGRAVEKEANVLVQTSHQVNDEALARIMHLLRGRRVLVLAGEGTCETVQEAREIIAWAQALGIPLLSDLLSGLRSFDDEVVIDNYEQVFSSPVCPLPEVVIRFGRYPISKRTCQSLAAARPSNIVVDVAETRDFNMATDLFVPTTPLDFVRSFVGVDIECDEFFLREWIKLNDQARTKIESVETEALAQDGLSEGALVRALLRLAPASSCVFSANSMSVRLLDAAYTKDERPLALLCNRGQNGIDGTVSTALGAAQHYAQTTFLTGDFTMLHDLNALALQREILTHHGGSVAPSIVIVLLNNNGGGIFDMLPQKSKESYFERLFVVPQDIHFADAAHAFGVPYRVVESVRAFEEAYQSFLGTPGITFIEVKLPYEGTHERYAAFSA